MNLKNRQQLLIALTVAVVGILALDKLVVSPYVDAWKARNVRIATLEESLRRGPRLLERTNSLQKPMEESAPSLRLMIGVSPGLQACDGLAAAGWTSTRSTRSGAITRRVSAPSRSGPTRGGPSGGYPLPVRGATSLAVQLEECELTAHDEKGEQVNLRVRLSGLQLPKKEPN